MLWHSSVFQFCAYCMKLYALCKDSLGTYWKEQKKIVIWNAGIVSFLVSTTLFITALSNVAYTTTFWQHHATWFVSFKATEAPRPHLFFFYNITKVHFTFAWQHSLRSFTSSDQRKQGNHSLNELLTAPTCASCDKRSHKNHFALRVRK